jgi:hypothetical protein
MFHTVSLERPPREGNGRFGAGTGVASTAQIEPMRIISDWPGLELRRCLFSETLQIKRF